MSTTATQEKSDIICDEATVRLLSAADLAALPTELPSGTVRYELYDGRLTIMAPTGDEHGAVENQFSAAFLYEGQRKGHGKARCGETGIILSQNPFTVVGADALFITNESLPIRTSPEGYLLTIPELVVEVMRKNDTLAEVKRKVDLYLQAGVVVVWVADPKKKTVTEFRRDKESVFTENDVLTVEDIIPDLRLSLGEVFAK